MMRSKPQQRGPVVDNQPVQAHLNIRTLLCGSLFGTDHDDGFLRCGVAGPAQIVDKQFCRARLKTNQQNRPVDVGVVQVQTDRAEFGTKPSDPLAKLVWLRGGSQRLPLGSFRVKVTSQPGSQHFTGRWILLSRKHHPCRQNGSRTIRSIFQRQGKILDRHRPWQLMLQPNYRPVAEA